jgi:hypothetical protein
MILETRVDMLRLSRECCAKCPIFNLFGQSAFILTREAANADCHLKSRWLDVAFEDNYVLCRIIKDAAVVKALKNCKSLKNVSIQFSSHYLEDRRTAHHCWIPLEGFRDLTSLELFSFYGSKPKLVDDLASLLCSCPGLKTLGLGMACDFDCEELPETLIIEDEDYFLEKLCMVYESKGNPPPLALETLRLGYGMYLFQPPSSTGKNDFLSKLVKVAGLKILHLFNDSIKYGSEDADRENMEIDWALLNECKSLYQLAISRLEPNVTDWLNGEGQSVQELIVSFAYTMYDDDLDEFDRLRLPKLTMLYTSEAHVAKQDDDDAWTDADTDSSGSEPSSIHPGDRDSSHILSSELIEPDPQSRPRIYDRSVITVLNRLHDGGAQLTALRICLDFESQWVSIFICYQNVKAHAKHCSYTFTITYQS